MHDLKKQIQEVLEDNRLNGGGIQTAIHRVHKNLDLRRELQLDCRDIFEYDPSVDVLDLIPAEMAKECTIFPLEIEGTTLLVAMSDPMDFDLGLDLNLLTGLDIRPVSAESDAIYKMIARYYDNRGNSLFTAEAGFKRKRNLPPMVALVNDLIRDAISSGVSDIHVEPFEKELQIRFRLDGILQLHRKMAIRNHAELISRLKIMASMNIAEKRRPQDGRIRIETGKTPVDIRVSSIPSEHGEKIVLRILDRSAVALELESLGLEGDRLNQLEDAIQLPYGMILVTGPTGSGKTTTLYSALNRVNKDELNISTIEDPVEYKMKGITQTNVKPLIGLTFAKALRTLLRQDPNVIMVGEIRDEETADLAVRSALTGHLVFSTLHTNDASSAFTRLADIGVEPYIISSALSLVIAQRLVRKVCPHCSAEYKPHARILKRLGVNESTTFFKGKGCFQCGETGYKGRVGLFEILPVTEALRNKIRTGSDASILRNIAESEGMVTLRQDGLDKAMAGVTTPEEVLRETGT